MKYITEEIYITYVNIQIILYEINYMNFIQKLNNKSFLFYKKYIDYIKILEITSKMIIIISTIFFMKWNQCMM